jgi:molybdopterin/thiamine biosynthesis adenylyltransferase
LDDAGLLRYSRHIFLDELGIEGQDVLLRSRVLLVGVGGLGSPAALYLAASGVGTLHIADFDVVELSNLQRQIALSTADVGRSKLEATAARLSAVNADCVVKSHEGRLDEEVLATLLPHVDLVLDCSDNFETRHAVNRACLRIPTPLVSGAAIRFDGQIAVFDARRADSPCYACLFPVAGAEEERCSERGVLSPLVGIMGAMQALEAIKVLTGVGESLVGRLLMLNAKTSRWHEVRVPRDPECPVCGQD